MEHFYKAIEREINQAHDIMLQEHDVDDHPIIIKELGDATKIRRLIRHGTLNGVEKVILEQYAELLMLAGYLELASDIYKDIHKEKGTNVLEEPVKSAIDNIRLSACRHNSLVKTLNIKPLPKKFCNFRKNVAIESKTNGTKYVLSVLKHGKKNMKHILLKFESLKRRVISCDLVEDEDLDVPADRKRDSKRRSKKSRTKVDKEISRIDDGEDKKSSGTSVTRSDVKTVDIVSSSSTQRQLRSSVSPTSISKRRKRRRRKNKKRRHNKRGRKHKKKGGKNKTKKRRKCRRKMKKQKKSNKSRAS